ncbi:MAG: archaemetzincin family Zn-dependent metalloprotease [Acidobacteria bacterium]|nr:archaemetzincin family Zn-dependent metalloprotease [Acidobacteriota bacterium]
MFRSPPASRAGSGLPRAREPSGHRLLVVPVGALPPHLVERAVAVAHQVLGFSAAPSAAIVSPDPYLDARRRQYRADQLMAALKPLAQPPGTTVLGLTTVDLFLPVLTYVFGFAELGGTVALVSTHRLDPQFDGRPADPGLTLERAEKEILHELGHVLGLRHCPDRRCVMASAHDTADVDLEEPSFCRTCRGMIQQHPEAR